MNTKGIANVSPPTGLTVLLTPTRPYGLRLASLRVAPLPLCRACGAEEGNW
jgi:hypothetical protein